MGERWRGREGVKGKKRREGERKGRRGNEEEEGKEEREGKRKGRMTGWRERGSHLFADLSSHSGLS